MRWILSVVAALSLATPVSADTNDVEWSAKANYVDVCSCAPSCPCLFGSPATLGFCEGATLVELTEARYGDVSLDGVKVLAVYRSGTWIKFYVDDDATEEQAEAAATLLPTMEGFFAVENVVEVKTVPIDIERGEDTIKITTANTTAHIEMMKGKTGMPIKIVGLPAPSFPGPPYLDHTQYKTILLKHDGSEHQFEHTGTNGFTARIDVNSTQEH